MNDPYPSNNIDSLLVHLALQTRELSQKKNEINQKIKVCRADIAERRSSIETIHRNIKKLEEDIRLMQSTSIQNKANAKSMKATTSLLLQYEHTLKAELESREATYNHDMEVYEERIASYRGIFQSHKEYYCQNPLALTLFRLQAEKEEIESRIKACDDQITMKQKELDHLTDSAVTEKLPYSVFGQQPLTEPEKQFDPQTEEASDSAIDISSLHLNQTKMLQNGHKVSVEAKAADIHEEHNVQDTGAPSPHPEDAHSELWSYEQLNKQSWPNEMHTDEQEKETELQDQERQSTVSEAEEAVEDIGGSDEYQTPNQEDNEGLAAFPHSSPQETNQSCPAKMTADTSTPIFPFNFSPASSPHRGTSDIKDPVFPFSLNSDPSTPAFSGFGFDMGTSQDEGTSFAFTSPFFNKKNTTEPKSSSCPEFLFGQSEQSEDFRFAFTSKSSEETNKDNTGDGFPFSFNF